MAITVEKVCLGEDGPRKATHTGELNFAGHKAACAVLEDGRRVLSDRGVRLAICYKHAGKRPAKNGSPETPDFVATNNLKPFISKGFVGSPILYRPADGGPPVQGYDCGILPDICRVYLEARRDGKLHKSQEGIAAACESIVLALAKTGIAAMIDEATGYQAVRPSNALQALFELYLRKDAARWQEMFKREFYKRLFALRGWDWNPANPSQGPRHAACLTRDIYERFSQDIIEEMERLNPIRQSESGKHHRDAKHHQFLTEEVGRRNLEEHLRFITRLMRTCSSWEQFARALDRAFPKRRGVQLDIGDCFGIDLFDEES